MKKETEKFKENGYTYFTYGKRPKEIKSNDNFNNTAECVVFFWPVWRLLWSARPCLS
jgi:hypothetical protein